MKRIEKQMNKKRVNDIFYSLQGEGHNTGRAAIFIRFSGCNLKCPFCDTDFSRYDELTDDDIIERIKVNEHITDDPRYDRELLAGGDRRNVIDRYRYWRMDAIVADLDARRQPLHVAIQNWEHDFNIGSIVRTANAFNATAVHILGRRRWNRRVSTWPRMATWCEEMSCTRTIGTKMRARANSSATRPLTRGARPSARR